MSAEHTNNPPAAAESEPTRQRILAAALDEFAEYGLAGGRVDRIAERASVNKAMIYYHFTSKETLYKEAIADIYRQALEGLGDKVSADQPFEVMLGQAADTYFDLFVGHPQIRPILLRELAEPDSEILTMVHQMIGEYGIPAKLRARFQSKMDDGTLRRLDLRHTLASFLALNIGSIMMLPMIRRILHMDENDAKAFLAERRAAIVDLFLNGVRARA